MRIGNALTNSVSLLHDDFEWIQPIDYEHVAFRCRKFHAHDHLFHDYPLNASPTNSDNLDKSDSEGFTKVTNRKRHTKKSPHVPKNPLSNSFAPSTNNRFDILSQPSMHEVDRSKTAEPRTIPSIMPSTSSHLHESSTPVHNQKIDPKRVASPPTSVKEIYKIPGQAKEMGFDILSLDLAKETKSLPENRQQSHMEEEPERFDLEDLDIFNLEQAYKRKEFDKISNRQLENLEVVLSRVH